MKLRDKTLLIIGLTFIPFAAIISMESIRLSYLTLVSVAILFSLLIFFLLYVFILKKIGKLNSEVYLISSKKNLSYRLPTLKTQDEIAAITRNINKILDLSRTSRKILEQRLEEQEQQFQTVNTQSQKIVSEPPVRHPDTTDDKECLTQISRYDTLTALPNRIFFNDILNKAISHAKRRNKNLAILTVDIDGFEKIYTQLGREKSDEVLKEIGKRFETVLRSEDIIAKLDGDEFIILLNDIGKPKFASTVAEKILKACSTTIQVNETPLNFTASIGICIYPNDGESLETLLQHSDDALYKAKHTGKNKYQFYAQAMDIEGHEYIQLENALRQAIPNNEFTIYYQPKMHIKKGTISGVEALIRWDNPQLGIVSPSKFINIAEESGLIMTIGEWALLETCKMNKHWQDEGYEHITASINLSPKQFHHPDITNVISKALAESGLNAKYLEIEITEKTIMDDAQEAAKILNAIKATGVQISIDHFGTGYTSISYLKQFPINILKIDQSFTKGIPNTPNDLAIISAIIALAHNLGLEVIAEGVETAEQVQYLASQNCDMVQGYFLSHPLPAQKISLQFKKLRDNVMI